MIFFSIVVPVYNRPDEVRELLESLTAQSYRHFEVVIVEDGSKIDCKTIVESFAQKIDLKYFSTENQGQGFARNFGFKQAKGDYFIVLDSDVIVPVDYLTSVAAYLKQHPDIEAFGGPDAAHPSFTAVQKAINYAMTATLVTGGIRGKVKRIGGSYQLRSYNLGVSRNVWEKTGGFAKRDMGEDIEWTIRINKAGFQTVLIPEAYVYHKRRGTFSQFAKQIISFGKTRIYLNQLQPGALKLVHWFPAAFSCYLLLCLVLLLLLPKFAVIFAAPLVLWSIAVVVDASIFYRSLTLGLLSYWASLVQLTSYGRGFIQAFFFTRP
jgi:glycosyltransferase involved in cell wall biosynthesis